MIIGHLPAGYIVAKLCAKKCDHTVINVLFFILAGVMGGIAPDLDMLYFHLIDQRQHHHHTYWSHYPIVWALLCVISGAWYRYATNRSTAAIALIFSMGGFIHLLLDSIVGDIWWLSPFIDKPYALFTVPALYDPWWLNFILHWSFALEISLLLWATYVWFKK